MMVIEKKKFFEMEWKYRYDAGFLMVTIKRARGFKVPSAARKRCDSDDSENQCVISKDGVQEVSPCSRGLHNLLTG